MPQEFMDMAIKVASAWLAGSLIGLERTFHGSLRRLRCTGCGPVWSGSASGLRVLRASYSRS